MKFIKKHFRISLLTILLLTNIIGEINSRRVETSAQTSLTASNQAGMQANTQNKAQANSQTNAKANTQVATRVTGKTNAVATNQATASTVSKNLATNTNNAAAQKKATTTSKGTTNVKKKNSNTNKKAKVEVGFNLRNKNQFKTKDEEYRAKTDAIGNIILARIYANEEPLWCLLQKLGILESNFDYSRLDNTTIVLELKKYLNSFIKYEDMLDIKKNFDSGFETGFKSLATYGRFHYEYSRNSFSYNYQSSNQESNMDQNGNPIVGANGAGINPNNSPIDGANGAGVNPNNSPIVGANGAGVNPNNNNQIEANQNNNPIVGANGAGVNPNGRGPEGQGNATAGAPNQNQKK